MRDQTTRVPVLSAAFAVALSARTGSLTLHQVEDMRTKAEELCERGDELRSAVILFATEYEAHRRDPVAMASLGEQLQRDVERATRPDLPGHDRRDIHG